MQPKDAGGFQWGVFLASLIFFPIRIFLWKAPSQEMIGRDKVYELPMYVCAKCKPALKGVAAIKQCMMRVSEYRNLLDKFPNAKVDLVH
jgi:hypothetical protein